jgi:hypothetical protein
MALASTRGTGNLSGAAAGQRPGGVMQKHQPGIADDAALSIDCSEDKT